MSRRWWNWRVRRYARPPYSSGGAFRGDRAMSTTVKYTSTTYRPDFAGDNRDQRYRDAVYDKALKERGPVVRALLERKPDCSDNELLHLLGIGEGDPKPAPMRYDPECPKCEGEGIFRLPDDTFAKCDCLTSNVTPLRRTS